MRSSSSPAGDCLFSAETHRLAKDLLERFLRSTSPATATASLLPDDAAAPSPLSQKPLVRSDDYAFLMSATRSLRAIKYITQHSDTAPPDALAARQSAEIAKAAARQQSTAAGPQGDNGGLLGTAYYEFLVAWSGLSTASPWPHCVQAEARGVVERAREACHWAERNLGRASSRWEEWLLKIALADAEVATGTAYQPSASSGGGGLLGRAQSLYLQVLSELTGNSGTGAASLLHLLLRSKCWSGIVSIAMRVGSSGLEHVNKSFREHDIKTPEELSRRNLELLLPALDESSLNHEESWYVGVSQEAHQRALRLQISLVRHQVASSLLRVGRLTEAESFLQDAVKACPDDAGAAFALGAFRLRLVFFHGDDPAPPAAADAARDQLLKAAKLDASRASPFALLGYYFELTKDEKRAVGCYSKALLLDPSHPVAGRGLLRLRSSESLLNVLQKATDSGSSLAGWAWRALGGYKAMNDGNDELAVVSLLQALRCADIRNPNADELSIFYASPISPTGPDCWEFVDASADLAACYRRLGRFTASLRSYNKALEATGDGSASTSIVVACAQGTLVHLPSPQSTARLRISLCRNRS
jgi:tetratricopeptide (TPR) repeat protein